MSNIPDLVRDSRLETRFHTKYTAHRFHELDLTNGAKTVIRVEYWQRQRRIGGGSYGRVWLERCVKGGRDHDVRAVKEIDKPPQARKHINYHRELEAIAKFSHDRYVRCFVKSSGWYEHNDTICIAMEYFPLGDLNDHLATSPQLPEIEAREVVFQLLEGLNFLHENGFAHRDLKPSNVLIKAKPPESWLVKIGDFGISKRAEDGAQASSTLKGTLGFMPPELHGFVDQADCFGEDAPAGARAADMWSLGEMTFQLLTKEASFKNMGTLSAFVRKPELFPDDVLRKRNISPVGIDLVLSLMQPGPRQRISADRAIAHAWVAPCRIPSPRPLSLASFESSDVDGEVFPAHDEAHAEPSGRWSTVSADKVAASSHDANITRATGTMTARVSTSQDPPEALGTTRQRNGSSETVETEHASSFDSTAPSTDVDHMSRKYCDHRLDSSLDKPLEQFSQQTPSKLTAPFPIKAVPPIPFTLATSEQQSKSLENGTELPRSEQSLNEATGASGAMTSTRSQADTPIDDKTIRPKSVVSPLPRIRSSIGRKPVSRHISADITEGRTATVEHMNDGVAGLMPPDAHELGASKIENELRLSMPTRTEVSRRSTLPVESSSDLRAGLSKLFGHRAEKPRQHVGITDLYEDPEYDKLRNAYDNNLVHLMIVESDCRVYEKSMTHWVDKMAQVADAAEGWMDVSHSTYQQEEAKLRHLVMIIRNVQNIALPGHLAHLQRKVIEPMVTAVGVLIKFRDDPKGLLHKRDNRFVDYARMKNKKSKGKKIDKRIAERMDQWEALNTEAMERMRKLLRATAHLVQTCQGHLVQLQMAWMASIQQKFASVMGININRLSPEDIEGDWQVDFDFQEAAALALGICNGALMLQAADINSRASTNAKHPPTSGNLARPGTIPTVQQDVFAPLRPSVETHSLMSSYQTQSFNEPPGSSNTFFSAVEGPSNQPQRTPTSGVFSSALPISGSPVQERKSAEAPINEPQVLFEAASIYQFNIDRVSREAGFPFLTYDCGEIFDVIGEKGELWLAKNQDDSQKQIGWIWEKHFVKLVG